MSEMRITARSSGQAPKYDKAASALLELCREFYQDNENVKAFEEWKAERSGQHEKTAV